MTTATAIASLTTADDLLRQVAAYLPPAQVELVERAYEFALAAHQGQYRRSGEPYIHHPLAAASLVADLHLDASAVAAALLHDVQEDCGVANSTIKARFGPEVARLVEGVSKLGQISWQASPAAADRKRQAENLRKMFLAMAQDVRVVIVKLADRLHNMRTLDVLSAEDRLRIARETMEIFAPLANRIGIWRIKWELEDLAFRYLEPARYKQVARLVAAKRAFRERYIAQVAKTLREELARHNLPAEVSGRAKHIYSIHTKLLRYEAEGHTFDDIHDLMGLRVLVETEAQCYTALGVIHALRRPLPGQFDDYIANPKENGYKSLHTAVMALGTQPLEVQIRTHEMHRLAEHGIASHWRYKEGGRRDPRLEEQTAWLRRLLEWQQEVAGAEEFVEGLKTDLFRDQVFVYTPKGELKELPAGSTPIDFAYRIHTDVGHRCVGAKVNGRLVPLNYQLRNGEVVEILVGRASRRPSLDWLNPNLGYLKTAHARTKIRAWFKQQKREENIERGRALVERELQRLGLTLADCREDLLTAFGYADLDDLFATVGYGEVSANLVGSKMAALRLQPPDLAPTTAGAPQRPVYTTSVQVLGTGDLLTQLGSCCNPVPGEAIIGYVTRSRGVTVHRRDCPNALNTRERERIVAVDWGRASQLYPVAVRIDAWDRVGLIRDIAAVVAEEHVSMVGVRTQEHEDQTVSVFLTLQTSGVEQLTRLLAKLEPVRGVTAVGRTNDGAGR